MSRLLPLIHAALSAGSTDPIETVKSEHPSIRQMLNWRPYGYGPNAAADPAERMADYHVDPARLATLTAPLLLLDPVCEHFWPGQGADLQATAPVPVHRRAYTAADGADSHCQPLAAWRVAEDMFDWMDTLRVG